MSTETSVNNHTSPIKGTKNTVKIMEAPSREFTWRTKLLIHALGMKEKLMVPLLTGSCDVLYHRVKDVCKDPYVGLKEDLFPLCAVSSIIFINLCFRGLYTSALTKHFFTYNYQNFTWSTWDCSFIWWFNWKKPFKKLGKIGIVCHL